jgi:hypothetical protein
MKRREFITLFRRRTAGTAGHWVLSSRPVHGSAPLLAAFAQQIGVRNSSSDDVAWVAFDFDHRGKGEDRR